ncbi:hypothetical protein TNCV_3887581 [Trichonephila clavipes]|nr:hypothetical protein TNCV_3887581 [Trichonephila clavipes]
MPDEPNAHFQRLSLRRIGAESSPRLRLGIGNENQKSETPVTLSDDKTASPFRDGAKLPKGGTTWKLRWGARIWIQISETPLVFLYIVGRRSNGFSLESHVLFFSIATKLSGIALRKYNQ